MLGWFAKYGVDRFQFARIKLNETTAFLFPFSVQRKKKFLVPLISKWSKADAAD
jgi:hypothetical protein